MTVKNIVKERFDDRIRPQYLARTKVRSNTSEHSTLLLTGNDAAIVIQLIIAMPIFSLFIISRDSTKYYPAGNILLLFCCYSAAIFDEKTEELSYYL